MMTPFGGSFAPFTRSADGFFPPSYQVSLKGEVDGALPPGLRAPGKGAGGAGRSKPYSMIDHFGGLSSVPPSLLALTYFTSGKFSAKKTRSMLWHPMSPIAPVPNSQNPRQLNGAYLGLYGRS